MKNFLTTFKNLSNLINSINIIKFNSLKTIKLPIYIFIVLIMSSCSNLDSDLFNKSNSKSQPAPQLTKKTPKPYDKELLELVNKERAKKSLSPLTLNKSLNKLATLKANDMAQNKYFDHNSKKLGTPFQMMKKEKIKYRTAGENIARGQKNPEEVMVSWMNSKGHRANILNPKFQEMGIGLDEYGFYNWSQLFIGNKINK